MTQVTSDEVYDVAVVVGQFQPFLKADRDLLTRALEIAPRVCVVVDSAYGPRSPQKPWTQSERAAVIQESLTTAERGRVECLFVRDDYDDQRQRAEIARQVGEQLAHQNDRVALVVHQDDPLNGAFSAFDQWQTIALPAPLGARHVTVRDGYFATVGLGATAYLESLRPQLPAGTLRALSAFAQTPAYRELAAEWQALHDYRRAWTAAPFPPVFVTVDAVVTCGSHVLLIRRGRSPGRGLLALPGGFLELAETTLQSALRELREETCLTLPAPARTPVRSIAFDHPQRSQRGRTISHAFHFDLGDAALPTVEAADDASEARWVSVTSLVEVESELFDDHFHILDTFLGLVSG
jgi:bifunctional NMN adenylyltransferase/nudix hydrolase